MIRALIRSAANQPFLHPNPRKVTIRLRLTSDLRSPDQRERFNALTLPQLIFLGAKP